ncbi:MAG TPA: hypothetical protein VJT85_06815 [Gemmatimonadaceae bacterium]|nr:hypothetical protein [Gemmatimonadaceae bacterium]
MIRRTSITIALLASLACSSRATEAVATPQPPDAFAGTWRSVTPPYEFVRLTVASLSSEMGALGARLTLSGVAWEGSGRITGDSLVINMSTAGSSQPTGVVVVRVRAGQTLTVQMRPASAAPLDLTLVREN